MQKVKNINPEILRKCREQIGLSLSDVGSKIPKIADIEKGEWEPTFKQLTKLAELYSVPRWVFTCKSLPERYRFDQDPSFRKFSDNDEETFSHTRIRRLTVMVERFRDFILDLRDDMDELVEPFDPPELEPYDSASSVARRVRNWLGCERENLNFQQWKEKLEEKNIFIFTTSKYSEWSHVEQNQFRGLAIYHSILPIIIINSSGYRKAYAFSLFHELGHLLSKKSEIDKWQETDESWCDELAANVLMPAKEFNNFSDIVLQYESTNLKDVRKIAKEFKVSDYACLIRMRQLQVISSKTYKRLKGELIELYNRIVTERNSKDTRIKRVRSKEVLDQYGHIYTKAVFQAYQNQDIGLNRLCSMFNLKKVSDALELEKRVG